MPTIRNSTLIKKFTDFFGLKTNDFLGSEAGRMLVPVITHPILPLIVTFTPTETEFATGIRVPAGKKWKLKQIFFVWTSDANAGNRVLELRITDGFTSFESLRIASRNNQATGIVTNYNFAIGLSHVGSGSGLHQTIPLPSELFLLEGSRIRIADSAAIAVGDSLTGGWICVEEENILEDEVENDRVI